MPKTQSFKNATIKTKFENTNKILLVKLKLFLLSAPNPIISKEYGKYMPAFFTYKNNPKKHKTNPIPIGTAKLLNFIDKNSYYTNRYRCYISSYKPS